MMRPGVLYIIAFCTFESHLVYDQTQGSGAVGLKVVFFFSFLFGGKMDPPCDI